MSLMAVDSDGDLVPDAWEDSHSMDKNNPEDASVDFDRDGLSALEEFELKAEGLGEGPLGKWTTDMVSLDFMNRPGSSSNRKDIVDFNDRGDILVNVTSWTAVWGSAPTYYHRVWFFNGSDSTWRKLSTVGGEEPSLLIAHDLNNEGVIVGQARAATANGGVAFGFMKDMRAAPFDESVAPWLDSGNGTVGDLTGINDFGEFIGVDAAGASFFQSPSAGTVSCPPGWVTPVFTAINNWGEVAGVEYSDYWGIGAPRHFLMTPGWHWLTDFPAFDMHLLDPESSELAESFGAGFRPAWINDWGEFTGNYWIETENQWWSGSWYFDGYEHDATMTGTDPVVRYRDLLPEGYTHQTVRGLNNWPQILVSGSTNDQEESPEDFEVYLVNGPQRVALSALSSVPAISDHTYENSMPVAINNRGTIIGWANSGNSLYLLTLDQDRDGDGMSNDWETFHGLDPDDPSDAFDDPDGDGASNLAEFRLGSAPTSTGYRLALDSDGDGLPDAWERKMFGNLSAGPDDDNDGDGLDNWEEWVIGSSPHLWDSDGDGWDDFEEFFIRGTDPSNADTDGDGIPDLAENLAGSDPKDPVSLPRFPPYLRVEVKTVTNSELIPDEFVTPEFYYWAVHVPLDSAYNQGFASALFDLSLADRQNDAMDQSPLKSTRLVSDYPGTEDYRFSVLRITTIHGNGQPQVVNVEMKEFMTPAGQKASNEIATEAEQEGLVYLVPVEVVSADKFLAGSFEIPPGCDSLEMEFVGPGDENLGKYGQLLGGGSTKIYDQVEDILSESDVASGGQLEDQKVWFVKDSENDRTINFYTCFNSLGKAEVKLYLNGSSSAIGSITQELKAEEEFADIIDYVDDWVKGDSFHLPDTTQPPLGLMAAPLAMQSQSAFGEEGISNLTRAALIPFFNVVNQVEGLSSVAVGLFDGVRNGIEDDWEFIKLIGQAAVFAGDYAHQQALAELRKWKDDPLKRASELKQLADTVCEDWVFEPMRELREDLSTWEGFKRRAWQTMWETHQLNQKAWTLTKSAWSGIIDGLTDWADDFCDRMMTGSEKAHWENAPWVTDHLFAEINSQTRLMCYTFGYTFGYIAEQIAVGALSGGSVKVAQVASKSGVALANNLAKRTAGALSSRAHSLKGLLAQTRDEFFDDLVNASGRNLSPAGVGPTGQGLPKPPLAVMQEGAAAGKFKWASYWGDVYSKPTLRKFSRTTAGAAILEKQMSRLMTIFGDEFTEALGRNFLKVADEFILVKQADEAGKETLDEFFEAFFKGFEGNPSLMKNADEVAVSTGGGLEPMSDHAKLFLKEFLSEPNAGNLWKLDDIPHIPNWQNTVPHKFWVRGNLFEVLYYKKVYKGRGHTHHSNALGFDTRKLGPGPEWTQIKSAANPNSAHQIQRMKQAIDDLVLAAGQGSPDPLILHILTRDDAVAATVDAVKSHAPQLVGRLTIKWERYVHPQ
jgi:hypothetical protein